MELAHICERRTALVDLNLEFGDVSCAFDCNPEYTVADVCREDIEVDRVLLGRALLDLPCNVSVLARPHKIDEARVVTPDGVANLFKSIGGMFPYVVVDLPRMFSFLSAAAVQDADHVLIDSQLCVPLIRNAKRIYECLLQMGAREETVNIVLNRCNATYDRITPEEVASHFGKPPFASIPNDYKQVQNSLDLGHPIVADAPSSTARLAIREMAKKLGAEHLKDGERPAPPQRFLSRLFKRTAKAEA
jgi:pilus assembly protein CpaE